MEPLLIAERYSHGVRLTGFSRDTFYKMQGFLEGLSLKEPKKIPGRGMIMELKKKYYGLTEDHREITIHRNCYDDLVRYLGNQFITPDRIKVVDVLPPSSATAYYDMYEKYVLRDYQEIIKEDALREGMISVRIDLQTGKGKTLTSLAILKALGVKCIVMVPPKYFGIWDEALMNTYKDIGLRFCRISGSAEIMRVIDRGIENDLDEIDVYLVSTTSYRNYIEKYEKHGEKGLSDMGYNCPPQRFHEVLQVGCVIHDEIQEDPGLLFRIDMYSNVAKQIYLSATPFTGNAYVTKMIDVMLPEHTKVRLPNYDVYINVMGVLYNDIKVKPKDYLAPFKNTYNHARYETEMMKNPKRLADYLAIVTRIVEGVFIKDRLPGQKCLLLFATVAFIELVMKHLKEQFPDVVSGAHYAGSDYNKLLTNELTGSTIKSSGTGVDIPNLREGVLFHNTGSKKDSIQIAGRLRKLRDFPDVTPRLTCALCQQVAHHLRYWAQKEEDFKGKIKTMYLRRIT
jgi:superfamily II DNA or RNA helicase